METTLLSIEQMRDRYPDQWLLVVCHKMDDQMEVLAGEVIAHSADRDVIYDAIAQERKTRKRGTLAIEYTGTIPDDAAFIL
jgi:hypothetical protein